MLDFSKSDTICGIDISICQYLTLSETIINYPRIFNCQKNYLNTVDGSKKMMNVPSSYITCFINTRALHVLCEGSFIKKLCMHFT